MDTSQLLDGEGINKYQSLIGTLQWTITLGRFDIATAVMSMSGFRVAPRIGHLQRLKRICGYLAKFRDACIRVRTEQPDYSDIIAKKYDWARTAYGDAKEVVPPGVPEPRGKTVTITTYKDANLLHDVTSGKAVSGVLHFMNQTPIDWYSKKQATCEGNIWHRVLSCKNSNRADCRTSTFPQVLGCTNRRMFIPVRRQ